jgi:ribosome-associated protein
MTARPAADAAAADRDGLAASERPSKTKRKTESHELQALGESLLELADEHLASLGLDETLVDAIRTARRIRSHERAAGRCS